MRMVLFAKGKAQSVFSKLHLKDICKIQVETKENKKNIKYLLENIEIVITFRGYKKGGA